LIGSGLNKEGHDPLSGAVTFVVVGEPLVLNDDARKR